MPTELYGNNASTTVAAAKTAVSAGTTETWTVASSAAFPAASNTASPATQFAIIDQAAQTEIIRVTNVSGTTWTVTRGVEGTTPVAHSAGFTVVQVVTNNALRQIGTNNDVALRKWSTALADVANNPADLLFIGDSGTEGAGSSLIDARYVNQVRDQLRALIPAPGVAGGMNYIPCRYVSTTFPVPVSATGSPATTSYGLGGRAYDLTTTTPVVTFTVTGTSIRICYVRSAANGIGSYSIDGATAVNFNCATGNIGRTDSLSYTTVTFAARGTHTVAIKYVSGGGVSLEGLVVFDGDETKGVRVYEAGYFGTSTADIVNTWINAGLFGFRDRITMIQPALVVVQFGTNDASTTAGNLSAASYKANLLTIIAEIKAGCTITPSIVLMGWFAPNVTYVEPWGNYIQQLYDIAAADSACCVMDLTGRLPPVSGDVLGLYYDAIHLNNKGQISTGAMVANYLTVDEKVASTLLRLTSRITAAATSTATAYATTGLSVSLQPNIAYTFRAYGQYRSAATTTGIGFRINFSGTTTAIRYQTTIWGAATSASTPLMVVSSANQGANLSTATFAATTDYAWEIEGVIRVGAAGGTLTVEFASEVGASTVTVQPDSVLYAEAA